MNRFDAEDDLVCPFISSNQRKLVKYHRRKLRRALFNIKDSDDCTYKERKALESNLRETRERIIRSRALKVETVDVLKDTMQIRSNWSLEMGDGCYCRYFPSQYHGMVGGCHIQEEHFAFRPLDLVADKFNVLLCPGCFEVMCCSRPVLTVAWDYFFNNFKFHGKTIAQCLPLYVDYKRTSVIIGDDRLRISQKNRRDERQDVVEERSEDEDDGVAVEECEGHMNVYVRDEWGFYVPSAQREQNEYEGGVDVDFLISQME